MTDEAPAPEAEATEVVELLEMQSLTLAEFEWFEDYVGLDNVAASYRGIIGPKSLTAFMFLTMRRTKPDLTIEEVRAMTVRQVEPGKKGKKSPNPKSSAG